MKKSNYFRLKRPTLICLISLLVTFQAVYCQYPANYQYALLPERIIDLIIESASGELAMQHINNLAPYSRPRKVSEFPGRLSESDYIINKLREYGIRNYSLDSVGQSRTWRGIEGSVWEISPKFSKIADYNDVPEMLAEGSLSAAVRAKLIWAGEGEQAFFEDNKQNVKGKIVVTSGNLYAVHAKAMNSGALGTISYFSSRPLEDPVQIPNMGIRGEGFAFMLPPREGVILRDRLLRRENIEVEVKVRSSDEKVNLLVPDCIIQGTDTTAGEIIFTAHLFEGYIKMGANDNMSGSAVILEVAHLLNDLIGEGRIARPVRTIRFLWVPEINGTISWANMHPGIVKKALCDLNLDMVGLKLRDNKSFFCLNRSGYSTANFANDIMESYFRYAGETNVDGITDYLGRRGFSRRIISPTGTDDPFYYRIMSLHGSSDNAIFNDWTIGVPGLKMITWPDSYYHSSEDNPDKCDPTQLRRAIFISAAGAYTMASAGEESTLAILSEMYSGALTRTGIQTGKADDMILKSDSSTIGVRYRRAVSNLEGLILGEKSALDKVRLLSAQPQVIAAINKDKEKLDDILQMQVSELHDLMDSKCRMLGMPPVSNKLSDIEKAAAKVIPHPTKAAKELAYGGDQKYISKLDTEFRTGHPYKDIVNTDEAAGLADGKRNLLQIKKIVDVQFEKESPLQDIINYFAVLKEAGLMDY